MAPCPYRIVYQGPNGGKVAFKRDGMLPGHFIRYGVQNGTKQLLPDWWDLSESMSFTGKPFSPTSPEKMPNLTDNSRGWHYLQPWRLSRSGHWFRELRDRHPSGSAPKTRRPQDSARVMPKVSAGFLYVLAERHARKTKNGVFRTL